MEGIGESRERNEDFKKAFSRENLIKGLIDSPDPVILDVGGHKGESVTFLRRLFPRALIHSFEPDPDSFHELEQLADAHTHCHNLALSDEGGSASFFRNRLSHTNSLYKVNLDSEDSIYLAKARRHLAEFDASRFNAAIEVPTRRLEDFIHEHAIGRVDLLKLDVQGAESKVLAGAGRALDRVRSAIIEVSFFDYYEHHSSFREIETLLEPFDFALFSISEISNNPMNGRTDWAEVIYRRRTAAGSSHEGSEHS